MSENEPQLTSIFDYSKDDLQGLFQSLDEPAYRIHQLWDGLYQKLWNKPEQFTNLPNKLKYQLRNQFCFSSLTPLKEYISTDNSTHKTLFSTRDGNLIETVLMKYHNRNTICISSQSGCGMGCVFCATGHLGFKANLSCGEIIEQVLYYARKLRDTQSEITNIVFMGMGEPFHNYENTLKSIRILNDIDGCHLSERRFTISTVGIVPQIYRFTTLKSQINLAVSLHAADDELRRQLIKVARKYSLYDIIEACTNYVQTTKRRVSFEWALIQGVNDSLEQAEKLAFILQGLLCHVNLIPLNPSSYYAGKPTPRSQVQMFKNVLERHGVPCTVRLRRGIDIQAGCGQLAAQNKSDVLC